MYPMRSGIWFDETFSEGYGVPFYLTGTKHTERDKGACNPLKWNRKSKYD